MAKRRVFVSFDWDHDRRYKFLLQAWDANKRFDFSFSDYSSQEINTNNVSAVKGALTRKINQATYTLVIVGKYANSRHKDQKLIGYQNWLNFEITKSKENGNKLVAVKLDKSYTSPDELLGANASWAMSFNEASVVKALDNA
ncbi:MAG: TIR domain-containing protein [bacterium]